MTSNPLKPFEITNLQAQKRYRDKSKSKPALKNQKDVAHAVSKEIVCYIQNSIPGPKPIDALTAAANDPANLHMIFWDINQWGSKQNRRTTKIMKIWKENEGNGHSDLFLNGTEAKRARKQCKIIQDSEYFTSKFKAEARKKYKNINVKYKGKSYSKVLWDDRRNRKQDDYKDKSKSESKPMPKSQKDAAHAVPKPSKSPYYNHYYSSASSNKKTPSSKTYKSSRSMRTGTARSMGRKDNIDHVSNDTKSSKSPSSSNNKKKPSSRTYKSSRRILTGSKGGQYYINPRGNKTYVSSRKYDSQYYEQSNNQKPLSSKSLMAGPRGGNYYMNKNGNRTYVSPSSYKSSSAYSEPATSYSTDPVTSYSPDPVTSYSPEPVKSYSPEPTTSYSEPTTSYYSSNGSANGSQLYTGSRGGTYYINSNGNKSYV
eukprot:497956_1